MSSTTQLQQASIVRPIALAAIRMDESSQSRVNVKYAAVRTYAEVMKQQLEEGQLRFPAIVLFYDGRDYWLADGFHRVLAARAIGLAEFPAEIHDGSRRDALLFAISANSAHGLPRSKGDRKKAVCLLLADPEWSQWSDREIARRCQVDHHYVGRLRTLSGEIPQMRQRKARRGSTVYEIDTSSNRGPADAPPNEGGTQVPAAAEPFSSTDPAGIPLSEPMKPVFARLADFQSLKSLYAQMANLIDRIAREPGGEMLRQDLQRKSEHGKDETFACAQLDMAVQKLVAAAPYCSFCPRCHALHLNCFLTDCRTCHGRGWTTRDAFEACPETSRRDIERALCPPAGTG